MPVALDTITGFHLGTTVTLTWTHTTGAGATLLVVNCGFASGTTVTGVTYGAANLTALPSATVQSGVTTTDRRTETWYLINPPAGGASVTVTLSGAVNQCASSATFTGTDTTTPFGTVTTANGTGTTMNIPAASSSSSGLVLSGLNVRSTTPPTAPTNIGLDQQILFNVYESLAVIAGAATVTPSWSMTVSDVWAGNAIPVLEAIPPTGIFVRGVGTPQAAVNTGTASISTTPTLPAGTIAGDRVYIVTHNSPATTTPTTPANWTLVDSQSLGTGTLGATAGPRRTSVYYRDYDGVWTMPSVVLPSVAAPAMLTQSISLGKDSSAVWGAPASTFGSDVTVTTTPYSATGGATVPFSQSDLALVTFVGPGLSAMSAEGLTATGATFGTVTEQYDAASVGATNGIHGALITAPVTAGAATAAPVATGTVSVTGQSAGGSIFIDQGFTRVQPAIHSRARFRAANW